MKIIYRYVLKDFLKYLFLCLAVLVFIYVVINLFDNLGKYLARNALLKDIVIYYGYLIPSYITLLIPVASIMAVFLIFGIMTKNKEMTALKMCGLNINKLFVLILTSGVIISAATFVFQESVAVWAQSKMVSHKEEKIDKRPKKALDRRSNFFYHGENNWIYFVRKLDYERMHLDRPILWQVTSDNRIARRIDAAAATYDSIWTFYNATVREFDTTGNERIDSYEKLPLPELKEHPQDFLKRVKALGEMNFLEIISFVKKMSRAGQPVFSEAVELHYRFSNPLITIIVLLIALPLSVALKRGGIAIGLGFSIILAFLYWGVIQSCRAYGVAGFFDPLIAAWLPNALFGLLGFFLVWRVRR